MKDGSSLCATGMLLLGAVQEGTIFALLVHIYTYTYIDFGKSID